MAREEHHCKLLTTYGQTMTTQKLTSGGSTRARLYGVMDEFSGSRLDQETRGAGLGRSILRVFVSTGALTLEALTRDWIAGCYHDTTGLRDG
jgi:hypothetical protein